jgi:hypothetical protein
MNRFVATENLAAVFQGKVLLPTITMWNRLEGRPRRHDFERALKAEIRDPLWMLTRQWQMGEFEGDDAGSPVFAKVHVETTRLSKYRAVGQTVEPFDDDVPLEAKVERQPIPFGLAGQNMGYDIRLAMGRRWLKLIGGIEPGLGAKFIAALPVPAPDPADAASAPVAGHRESWQALAAMAGRAMDGLALHDHLAAAPGNHAHELVALANPASAAAIETAETEFVAWYGDLFYQPAPGSPTVWNTHSKPPPPRMRVKSILSPRNTPTGTLTGIRLISIRRRMGLAPSTAHPCPQTSKRRPPPASFRYRSSSTACQTPAGGPLKKGGPALATSTPIRRT